MLASDASAGRSPDRYGNTLTVPQDNNSANNVIFLDDFHPDISDFSADEGAILWL